MLHSKIVKGVLVVGLGKSDITPIIITISTVVKKIVEKIMFLVLLVSYYCLLWHRASKQTLPTNY